MTEVKQLQCSDLCICSVADAEDVLTESLIGQNVVVVVVVVGCRLGWMGSQVLFNPQQHAGHREKQLEGKTAGGGPDI